MPVRATKGGYQWGSSGKVYPDKASAEKQGRAAYANGYKGKNDAADMVKAAGKMRDKMLGYDDDGDNDD
jgi:hypothetical protein